MSVSLSRAGSVIAAALVVASCTSTLDEVPKYFSSLPATDGGGPINDTVVNPKGKPAVPAYTSGANPSVRQADIDLTRYLNLVDSWRKPGEANDSIELLTDLYMRLEIRSHVPEAGVLLVDAKAVPTAARQYGRERSGPERLVIGKSRSMALQANVQITGQTGFNTNAPLLATSYHANKDDAETWITDIVGDSVVTPYFRVDPRATLSVNAKLTLSEEVSSTAVKVLLTLAREIAQIAVPESAVVTTLTRDKLDQQARTLDNAIGNLFSLSVAEGRLNSRDLAYWSPDRGFAITLHFPELKADEKSNTIKFFHLGTWSVNLSYPRPSIFSKYEFKCDPGDAAKSCTEAKRKEAITTAFKDVSPEAIFNEKVAENLTVEQYLLRQDWFAQSIGAKNSALKDEIAARQFCSKVVTSLFGLGLNSADAHAGLWAVLATQPMEKDARAGVEKSCKMQLDRIGEFLKGNEHYERYMKTK